MTKTDQEFAMSSWAAPAPFRLGLFATSLCGLCIAFTAFCGVGWAPADWLQPSIVGLLWANVFMLGMASGKSQRGSLLFACLALCLLWLSKVALNNVTALLDAECILIVASIYGASWLIAILEHRSVSFQPSNIRDATICQYRQWTLWDLATLTTLVAVICYAFPRIESPLILLANVMFVVAGGLMTSWIAYRWAMDDNWNLYKLAGLVTWGAISLWFLSRQSPDHSLAQIAAWMITGPLAVISMQGLITLLFYAAVRYDSTSGASLATQHTTAPESEPSPALEKLDEPTLRIFST